jgi:hypothetical protein
LPDLGWARRGAAAVAEVRVVSRGDPAGFRPEGAIRRRAPTDRRLKVRTAEWERDQARRRSRAHIVRSVAVVSLPHAFAAMDGTTMASITALTLAGGRGYRSSVYR